MCVCVCVCVCVCDKKKRRRKKKDYSTQSSQVVSNPSTNRARRGLTSLIGREVVLSSWYGRNQYSYFLPFYLYKKKKERKKEKKEIQLSLYETHLSLFILIHSCDHMASFLPFYRVKGLIYTRGEKMALMHANRGCNVK